MENTPINRREQLLSDATKSFFAREMKYGERPEITNFLMFMMNRISSNALPRNSYRKYPQYADLFDEWKERNASARTIKRITSSHIGPELGSLVHSYYSSDYVPSDELMTELVEEPEEMEEMEDVEMGLKSTTYLKKLYKLGFDVDVNGDADYERRIREAIKKASLLN